MSHENPVNLLAEKHIEEPCAMILGQEKKTLVLVN